MRFTALALATVLGACSQPSVAPPAPVTEPWHLVLACDQDDTLERMECLLEERPRMTRDALWWQDRVRRLYVRAVGGNITPDAAHDALTGMEMRILDVYEAHLQANRPTTYASARPIPALQPNWLGGGYGTPRTTCVPGAGSFSCY